MHGKLKFLHMAIFSPLAWLVRLVTNMRSGQWFVVSVSGLVVFLSFFIGSRCTWGPIYESRCLSLTTLLKLYWCDSGWWISAFQVCRQELDSFQPAGRQNLGQNCIHDRRPRHFCIFKYFPLRIFVRIIFVSLLLYKYIRIFGRI